MAEARSEVSIKLPVNYNIKDAAIFKRVATIFSVEVYEYNDVYVTGTGICFNRWLRLVPGSFMKIKRFKLDQLKIAIYSILFRKKRKLSSKRKYLVIHNQWFNGYYHWLIDCLPRLIRMEDSLSDSCLLLPDKARHIPFIQHTLSFFPGIEKEYLEVSEVALVPHLILPSHLPFPGLLDPSLLRRFKKRICSEFLGPLDKRIYVSRKKASRRRIINESAVVELLSSFGFVEVVLEDITFQEQVHLFGKAQIIVSIHGAGLTNLIFMSRGGTVVEIIKQPNQDESYPMDYQILSSIFDLRYYCLLEKPEHDSDVLDTADINVDIAQLGEIVKASINLDITNS